MNKRLRTRLAPTPSGQLHLGNIANFLLIEKLAKDAGASILLRIDDCDGTRARREYVEQIFETLRWLRFEWQEGPRDADDFYANFSQTLRKAHYFRQLEALRAHTYACSCSRRDIDGVYAGTCREKGLAFVPGQTALRLRVNDPEPAKVFGDTVLWRKDNGPAYQWASVVDDLEWGIDLIVRGEDLRASSELQKFIAALVRPEGLSRVRFVHHPLLLGPDGKKLAKSQGAAPAALAGADADALRARLEPQVSAWAASLN